MQLRGGPVLGENGRAVGIHEPVELGPTADLAAYDVDMTVTRRPATAADLARLEPPPTARPVRPGHAMHLMRQSTNPRSWRNYRSVMGADAPVNPLEDTVTISPDSIFAPDAPPALRQPRATRLVQAPGRAAGRRIVTALVAIRAERPLALWPAVVSTFREADLLPVVRCDAAEGVMPAS